MKRLIVILLSLGHFASAQVPYFNIQFDYNNWWETTGFSSAENDSFYMIPGGFGTPWVDIWDTAFILQINKLTAAIEFKKFGFFEGSNVTNVFKHNSSIIAQGTYFFGHDYIEDTDFYLCKYTENGFDTSTLRTFGLPGRGDYLYRPIVASNGDIVSTGWSFAPTGIQSLILFRCDSNLNQQYLKLLPPNPTGHHFGLGMVETPDKGFIIVGNRFVSNSKGNALIIKVDSAGNQVWWNEIPPQGDERYLSFLDIIKQEDGSYLAVGHKRIAPPLAGQDEKYWCVGLNDEGQILWSKEHNLNERAGWQTICRSQDGNYFASGAERDNVLFDNNGEGYWRQYGVISKITPSGDLLWHRRYSVEQLNKHYDIFFNVMATSDGGILCNGTTYENDTTRQNAWIVKLDSLGCLTPYCGPSVGVIELPVGKNSPMKIWPNPTSGEVTAETRDGQRIEALRVFDSQGREVPVRANVPASQVRFNLNGQPNGVYFCSVFMGGVFVVRQIVKTK